MGNDAIWYYADRGGQQQGPVEGSEIARLLQAGELDDRSLLWRDGMAEWAALGGLRAVLGLPAAAPPAPSAASDAYSPPKAALRDESDTPVGGNDVVPAGFLRRWAALFVDQIIVSMAYYAVFFTLMLGMGVFSAAAGGSGMDGIALGFMAVGYLIYFAIAGAYYAGFESSASQATPGKMVLGIKVCDPQGGRLSLGHALGRWMAAALSYLSLLIGFLMAAFTERKLALHDIVAGTQVVDRWAYTDHPERQSRQLHGCVVALLVFMAAMMLIAVLGILAAIAIPAYQDYTQRARGAVGQLFAPPSAPAATALRARIEWPPC